MRVMPVVIYCNWYFFHYLLLQGEEHPSGELLSSLADCTTKGPESQTGPVQDVDYDARYSELVVAQTHRLPKVTNVDEVVIGVKMIQLSDSHKLSLCI